jgi:tyrosyl-tRNA synthetase
LSGAAINEAKIALANAATALAHGAEAAAAAAETARRTFGDEGIGDELPTIEVPRDELERGIAAFELLRRAGLAASNGEARRLIKGGGGRLNDRAVESETQLITIADLLADGVIKLSAGKKRHALVRPA